MEIDMTKQFTTKEIRALFDMDQRYETRLQYMNRGLMRTIIWGYLLKATNHFKGAASATLHRKGTEMPILRNGVK